jgi:hypothetical protein
VNDREGVCTGSSNGDTVRDRRPRNRHDPSRFDARLHAGDVLGLHADDAGLGIDLLQGDRHARGKAAAADGHREDLQMRVLLEQFQTHGALAGNHPADRQMRERRCSLLPLQFGGALERVVIAVAVKNDLSAVLFGAALLREGGGLRHHDRRMDTVALGGKGEPLRVVAGGGRKHTGLLVGIVQPEHRVHRAAVLVSAGTLKVLHLQVELAIGPGAQRRRDAAGRQVDILADSTVRALNVVQGNRRCGSHMRSLRIAGRAVDFDTSK